MILFNLLVMIVTVVGDLHISELEPRRVVVRYTHPGFGGFMAMLTPHGDIEFYEERRKDHYIPYSIEIFNSEIEFLRTAIAQGEIIPSPISDHGMYKGMFEPKFSRLHVVDGKSVSSIDVSMDDPAQVSQLVVIYRRLLMTGLEEWDSDRYAVLIHFLEVQEPQEKEAKVIMLDTETYGIVFLQRPLLESQVYQRVNRQIREKEMRLHLMELHHGNYNPKKIGLHDIAILSPTNLMVGPSSCAPPNPSFGIHPEVGLFVRFSERLNCLETFDKFVNPHQDELILHIVAKNEPDWRNVALIRDRKSGDLRWLRRTTTPNSKSMSWESLKHLGGALSERSHVDSIRPILIKAMRKGDFVGFPFDQVSYHPVVSPKRSRKGFYLHTLDRPTAIYHRDTSFHPVIDILFASPLPTANPH